MNGNEIKEYLELAKELGIVGIDDKLLKTRDALRRIFEDALPDFCQTEFARLSKSQGSSVDRNMVKNFKLGYVMNPLSTNGSLHSDGRFHRLEWAEQSELCKCMYLAPNEHVVNAECRINPFEVKSPRANVWARVRLGNVFNVPAHEGELPFLRIMSVEPWEWSTSKQHPSPSFLGGSSHR